MTSLVETYDRLRNPLIEQKKKLKKILILSSRNFENTETFYYETVERIVEECDKKKLDYYVLFVENGFLERQEDGKLIVYNVDDKKGFEIDNKNTVVLNRGSVTNSLASMDMITQLEKNDFVTINTRLCTEICNDKYRSVLRLTENDITCPKTILVQDEATLNRIIEDIEGYPLIIKTLTGSEGIGTFIVESDQNLRSVLQTMWKINDEVEFIIQNMIEADGDIRVMVLDNQIIGAIKREKIEGDFRSNFSLGAKVSVFKLTDKQKKICLKVSEIVEGQWTGVDFMIGKDDEVFVLEVNSSPGTTGFEKATKINIVEKVINFALSQLNKPRDNKEE